VRIVADKSVSDTFLAVL